MELILDQLTSSMLLQHVGRCSDVWLNEVCLKFYFANLKVSGKKSLQSNLDSDLKVCVPENSLAKNYIEFVKVGAKLFW